MILILLLAFGAASIVPVWTGLRREGGFLHFAMLGGCVFLGQLFLQAIGTVRDADSVPHDGLVRALVMCILCALAMHAGWELPLATRSRAPRRYDHRVVFYIAVVFIAVGMTGFLLLAGLSGGLAAHFSVTGHYALDWHGLPVAYVFLMCYLWPGVFLALYSAIRDRNPVRYVVVAFPLAVNLSFILILGRRTVLFQTGLVVLAALWFTKRWSPPRWALLAAAVFGTIAIYAAPYYRTYSQLGADNEKLRDLDVAGTINGPLNGTWREEFYNSAWMEEIVTRQHAYQYGAGIYNWIVASFVPKLLVSEEFKERLFLKSRAWEIEANDFGWHIAYGANMSGPGSAYVQFWFFGFLWFFGLARMMKRFYLRGMEGDLLAQCLYAGCLTDAMESIGNYMYLVVNPLLMFGPVLYLSLELLAVADRHWPRPAATRMVDA